MMTWGTSAPSVILDVWYNNNLADENKRVMLTSVGVPVANLMGVVRYAVSVFPILTLLTPLAHHFSSQFSSSSSNIFQDRDAPKYLPALVTTACFGAVGCLLTLSLGGWMILDNKRRDSRTGRKIRAKDIPTESMRDGPSSEVYRWFY